MKKSVKRDQSTGLQFVLYVYEHATRKSWTGLNGCLTDALEIAIRSGMKFEVGDIEEFPKKGFWFDGELHYAAACGGTRGYDHPSFVKTFESYQKRKPWLWAEQTKTPSRLHVGARFHWEGLLVEVTSMDDNADHIIACNYESSQERKVRKRFTITHEELTAVRKAADARFRAAAKQIKDAMSVVELDAACERISLDHSLVPFRHFDMEEIRELVANRRRDDFAGQRSPGQIKESEERERADLERWKSGGSAYRVFNVIALRVREGFVETTTGQRASVNNARIALKFAEKYRESGYTPTADDRPVLLDTHMIKSITQEGCKIGCTFVPWSEIDRIKPELLDTVKPTSKKKVVQ